MDILEKLVDGADDYTPSEYLIAFFVESYWFVVVFCVH
jgi:hypothetical protein